MTSQQNKNNNNNSRVKCDFIYYTIMDANFIYYKELPLLDENIFSANLSQNNEIEEISLKKSNQHIITNLKINQKTNIFKISDEHFQTQLMQLHKNQKMSLLGVWWKWKIYFLQQSNLKNKTIQKNRH